MASLIGHLDRLDDALHGWVVDPAQPQASLELRLLVDGQVRASGLASLPRPDVAAAGLGGPACGFVLPLPADCLDGAEHELALQRPGHAPFELPGLPPRIAMGPVRFTLEAPDDGRLLAAEARVMLRQTLRESALDPSRVTPGGAEAWLARARDPGTLVLRLARANGRLVGYAEAERRTPGGAPSALLRMSILAPYRRRGIGHALLAWVEDRVAALGDEVLWLTVAAENLPARALYRKRGFVCSAGLPVECWPLGANEVAKSKRFRKNLIANG